jgi:hypothetical protein
VIAFDVSAAIEKTKLDQAVHTSWASVRNTLKTHQVGTIVCQPRAADACESARPQHRAPTLKIFTDVSLSLPTS